MNGSPKKPLTALAGGLALTAGLALVAVSPAASQTDPVIELPLTHVTAPPGSETVLASTATPSELVDRSCTVSHTAANNSSVHPGNHLVVRSGDSSVRLDDVERSPGVTTEASGQLTVGPTIAVDLIMGPDGVFSASDRLIIDCSSPEPATTTTGEPVTTTTEPDVVVLPEVITQLPNRPIAPPARPVFAQPSFTG